MITTSLTATRLAAALATCVMVFGLMACGDSDTGDPAAPPTANDPVAAPTTLPPDVDVVFRDALLTLPDLPTEWDPYTGDDSETLQRYGPEVCGRLGAERWSQIVFFIIGRPNDPSIPEVINRVYEYSPGIAGQVMDGVRQCISSGAAQPLSLAALGDDSLAAQTMVDDPVDGRLYTAAAAIRRGDFITLILYLQYDNPVDASQIEPFAVAADRRLERAIFEAPPSR